MSMDYCALLCVADIPPRTACSRRQAQWRRTRSAVAHQHLHGPVMSNAICAPSVSELYCVLTNRNLLPSWPTTLSTMVWSLYGRSWGIHSIPRQDARATILPHVGGRQPQSCSRLHWERHRAPAADLLAVVRVRDVSPNRTGLPSWVWLRKQHLAREVQGRDQPVAVELAWIAPVVAHPEKLSSAAQHGGVVVTRLESP